MFESSNSSTNNTGVSVADNERPVFQSCPDDIEVSVPDDHSESAQVSWIIPTATDNRTPPNVTSGHSPGDFFNITLPDGLPHEVRYVATDAAGLTSECTFTVRVHDPFNPRITCQPDLVFNMTTDRNHIVLNETQLFAQISDNDVAPVLLPLANYTFARGNHSITRVAMDRTGNQATCSFNVQVVDAQPPVLTGCQETQRDDTTQLAGEIFVFSWLPPLATDNDELVNLTYTDMTSGSVIGYANSSIASAATASALNLSMVLSSAVSTQRRIFVQAVDASNNTNNCTIELTVFRTSSDASTGASSSSTSTSVVTGASIAGGVLVLMLVAAVIKIQRNKRKKPHDFTQLLDMISNLPKDGERRKPREIKRDHVKTVSNLGHGNFGSVDKAYLEEQRAAGIPGYLVAVKQLLSKRNEDRTSLLEEAAVMAQVRLDFFFWKRKLSRLVT